MEKKLILVSAPPASGKTFVSIRIARALKHVVYLDKDDMLPLSNAIYKVANEPNDRSGDFYYANVRQPEYDAILSMGLSALKYDDIVLINAPFGKEIRDLAWVENMRKKLRAEYNARLVIVWVVCDIENVKRRMIRRNSPRDESKLKDWDAWSKTQNFEAPLNLKVKGDPLSLILFFNNDSVQFQQSLRRTVALIEEQVRS